MPLPLSKQQASGFPTLWPLANLHGLQQQTFPGLSSIPTDSIAHPANLTQTSNPLGKKRSSTSELGTCPKPK